MYTVLEIDTIFQNCGSYSEIYTACKIFKQLYIDGYLTVLNYKAVSKLSTLRFIELTN